MVEEKSKEQLLNDLIDMQKSLDQKVVEQDCIIRQFEILIRNEGLFSQVIDNFPYPIAIFDHSGVLIMANQILLQKVNINPSEVSKGRVNFLNRITNENYPVLEAVEDTFLGEITVLKELVEPLSLFAKDDVCVYSQAFQSAVFFPVVESGGHISHGAIMLMM